LIPFDQFLCLKYFYWRSKNFTAQKGVLLSLLAILVICSLNIHLNFTFEYDQLENRTFFEVSKNSTVLMPWLRVNIFCLTSCAINKKYLIFLKLNFIVFLIVPSVLLFLLLGLLIYSLKTLAIKNTSVLKNRSCKYRRLILSLFKDTLIFIILNTPFSVISNNTSKFKNYLLNCLFLLNRRFLYKKCYRDNRISNFSVIFKFTRNYS
jgi:hypothetical protein